MDGNNWRVAHGQVQMPGQVMGGETVAAAAMEGSDWRAQLQQDSRQRIVNKIMETLKRHLPFSGPEGMQELQKIAVRFEEKIYVAATCQADYLRKISMKMLTMESKSQNPMPNSLQPGAGSNSQDPGPQSISSQLQNHVQQLPLPMASNSNQMRQQLMSQNMHNNMALNGVPNSAGLTSALPTISGTMTNVPAQTANIQNMQSLNNIGSNAMGSSMGQGMPPGTYANSQRQIQGRQQPIAPQEQPQQAQGSNQYMYNQQLYIKQKFQQGGIPQQSMMPGQVPQQQQQNILQPYQLQSSQQAVMQSSLRQTSSSSSSSSTLQNQQSSLQLPIQSMLQQPLQSAIRQQQPQAPVMHQQQNTMTQHSMLSSQLQQHSAQQQNAASMQSTQLIGQQNMGVDAQEQQRMMAQQNSMSNMQQQQSLSQQNIIPSMHQQQSAAQQNSLPNVHQQQLGSQSNLSGFQQPMVGVQHGSSNLQANQQPAHMLQQSAVSVQQQMQASMPNMMPNQPQSQQLQHQMMTQMPSQPGQLQQQLGLQQQANTLSRDMQQRSQISGPLLQQQSTIDQKQILQSQRVVTESKLDSSQSGNASGGDWQEEIYQKIKSMHEMYYADLNETYQKMASRLQQHDSIPQGQSSDQLGRLNFFKIMLERLLLFLRKSKNEVQLADKEKIGQFEKQIVTLFNSNRPRKPVSSLQKGQIAQTQMPALQQPQQQQPQISQVHMNEGQMNQQKNLSSLPHTVSSMTNSRQSMMDVLQPSSNNDTGQGNGFTQMQQAAMNSLQQNPGGPQQMNAASMTSQAGLTTLAPSANLLQASSNMLQGQQIKQEPQMFSNQQFQQRQMQQQFMNRQQMMQQQLQQQSAQMPAQQMTQPNQMNDANDVKLRHQIGGKTGIVQSHPSSQRAAYHHPSFPTSSQHVLQITSPQIGHHSSPQIDQQNLLLSHTKSGTPLQSANSPFVVPSPSTSVAPSPMPGDSEKIVSGVTSLSNVGNIVNPPNSSVSIPTQSLAIGTPGISASPLLAEFTSPDGMHGVSSNIVSGPSNVVEEPLDRLIKAVKSLTPKALSASINDISSVVSLTDRIAGSAPGNGSRAAIGEDLVAMTKCRLQARNIISQDGSVVSKKMRRYTTAMTSNVVSCTADVNECLRRATDNESDEQSSAVSCMKRPRTEANHVLEEELREINLRLIDTVVHISDDVDQTAIAAAERAEGTIVTCSFSAVGLGSNLKLQFVSAQTSPIQPLRLLIPKDYPSCSPVLLDKLPIEFSKEYEDLSMKVKSRFGISLRTLSQPMSLGDIVRTWDKCARAVISEYAQLSGGGTFSSKYGTWDKCLSAA